MHVLMTVNAAWNIWNFRMPVVRALQAQGHSITILAPEDGAVAKLEAAGCRFIKLPLDAKGLNPIEAITLTRRFRQVFRDTQPDIVLSYTIKNNLFGAMATKSMSIPFVPNVTGLGTAFLSGGLLQKIAEVLYRRAFRHLPIVFFQNEDDAQLFRSRGLVQAGQIQMLPGSGIDLTEFTSADYPPEGQAPIKLVMIARLLRDKGVEEYVEAARSITQGRDDVVFQLVGGLAAENRTAICAETVKAWQEEGVIDYLGEVDDVRPLIAESCSVVLPSYREGAPRTLIEAAAMARPVIATDVPGCRAVVAEGISGLLCEARSAASLAQSVQKFLALSQEQKVAMGLAGRAKMEKDFDVRLVIEAYHKAIETLS